MDAASPLVTIMIPTYNQLEFLPVAVQSSLAQTYGNLEIVIADDNSPSSAVRALLEEYETNPRLRVCRNEVNLGRVANYRKTLYERARGKWVINLDGDDYFLDPTFIEQAVALAESSPGVAMVSGIFVDRAPSGRLKPSRANVRGPRLLPPQDAYEALLVGEYFPFHGSTIYRRERACAVGFYQHDIISADMESLLRLMQMGSAGIVPVQAMVRRRHGGNASHSLAVEEFIADIMGFSSPLRCHDETSLVSKEFLESWVSRYTYHKSKDDGYKILKQRRSNTGYLRYLAKLYEVDRKSALRTLFLPKHLLKMLRNLLGL